ncbi:MAG: leucine-rich repeat protein [Candidatus Methanoplasma sp.]|jgi:uncharacterized repeat protein (TIGR02543 family)|nr:leucine-rich repeat protein [Candidatus Methanoplasma sp.]
MRDEPIAKGTRIALAIAALVAVAAVICVAAYAAAGSEEDGGGGGEIAKPATHTVTYNSMGGSHVAPSEAQDGSTVGYPGAPAWGGRAFMGWFKDQSLTVPWSFATDRVYGDVTLYAKWEALASAEEPSYRVSFDAGGGTPIPDITGVDYGSRIAEPPAPSKTGYGFGGWYRDASLTVQWSFASDRVTGDVTLYARWSPDRFVITYHMSAASGDVETRYAYYGQQYDLISPSREGYGFAGWFLMPGGVNIYAGSDDPDNETPYAGGVWTLMSGLDLYAYWTGSQSLAYSEVDGGLSISQTAEMSGYVAIPEYVSGVKVVSIPNGSTSGKQSFSNSTAITGISIPATVETIGQYAFYKCSNLESLDFAPGSGLKSIGNQAFRSCAKLSSDLEIPASVEIIGDWAFNGCAKLNSISFGDESLLTGIGQDAFSGCVALGGDLEIPASVEKIGTNAFNGCAKLESLSFGEDSELTEIGSASFRGCSGLTGSLDIPAKVITISTYAFEGCSKLGPLSFEDGDDQMKIMANAFQNCSGLTGILVLPSKLTMIGNQAFQGCSKISGALVVPSSVTQIGQNAFRSCTGITTAFIPSSVTTMGANAFTGCTSLQYIDLQADSVPSGWPVNWSGAATVRTGQPVPQ